MAVQFVDEARIFVKAGDGGKGCVSFETLPRQKKRPSGGPGGNGGNVIIVGNHNLNTLLDFKFHQHYIADNGGHGGNSNKAGANGKNLIIELPLGSILTGEQGQTYELTKHLQNFVIKEGGKGGRGNHGDRYQSKKSLARETAASEAEITEGEWFSIELKLISDIGVIGMPNAGKSTFVRKISGAKPKVGDFPFTTLHPILGVVETDDEPFTIADLPGLIEGAHSGVGLGNRFLRHVSRVSCLLYMINAADDEISPWKAYQIVRRELEYHDRALTTKPSIIVLNKIDLFASEEEAKTILQEFTDKTGLEAEIISAQTGIGINSLMKKLSRMVVENLSESD